MNLIKNVARAINGRTERNTIDIKPEWELVSIHLPEEIEEPWIVVLPEEEKRVERNEANDRPAVPDRV